MQAMTYRENENIGGRQFETSNPRLMFSIDIPVLVSRRLSLAPLRGFAGFF